MTEMRQPTIGKYMSNKLVNTFDMSYYNNSSRGKINFKL